MKTRSFLLSLLAPTTLLAQLPVPQPAAVPTVGGRAVVAVRCDPARAFVGQKIAVTVDVRLEQRLWREQLIQLFRQRTDLAIRLTTPCRDPLDGFESLGAPAATDQTTTATAVVDGAVTPLRRLADEQLQGETFARFELVHHLVTRRAGTFSLRPASLEFAWAARFVEDFLGERRPADREDVRCDSRGVNVEVLALPTEGRPADFSGLVGRIAVQAELQAPPTVRVGDTVQMTLTVTGDGDLRPFRAPTLADLPGFWVRGVREQTEPGRHQAIYELAARQSGTHALPPLAVPFFAPDSAAYEVAASTPIGIAVAPAADGSHSLDAGGGDTATRSSGTGASTPPIPDQVNAPVPGVDVLFGPLPVRRLAVTGPTPTFAASTPPSPAAVVGWLAAPWLLFGLFVWLQRRARRRPERLRRRRRRTALRALQRALATPGHDRAAAVVSCVARWLDCAEAAVVGPRLPQHLAAIGVDPALAVRLDTLLDELAAPRFGADAAPPDDAAVLTLAAAVDRQVREHERRRRPGAPAAAALLAAVAATPVWTALHQLPSDPTTEAAHLLASGDAARAHELYARALAAGEHDAAALCFDLAACAHRLDRPAEAVLWYERALRVQPMHFESRANLRLVQRQLGLADRAPRALATVAAEAAIAGAVAFGFEPAFVLAGALQLGGLLLLWRRRRTMVGGTLLALGLACGAVTANFALGPHGERAVVLRDGVRLLAEPHERANAIGVLPPGQTIDVLECSPRWARVRQADSVGWIDARAFERVARP